MNLLSVDWDYFFPVYPHDADLWMLYDWGHSEAHSGYLQEILWYGRAAAFRMNDLPLPATTGEEMAFWERFRFSEDCRLYLADSHVQIARPEVYRGAERVFSFDAHHDAGYRSRCMDDYLQRNTVTCEDWVMAFHAYGIKVDVIYPKWKEWAMKGEPKPSVKVRRKVDDGKNLRTRFDKVFVCRSGGWTPPWVDEQFEQFLQTCPVSDRVKLQKVTRREWSEERLQKEVQLVASVRVSNVGQS